MTNKEIAYLYLHDLVENHEVDDDELRELSGVKLTDKRVEKVEAFIEKELKRIDKRYVNYLGKRGVIEAPEVEKKPAKKKADAKKAKPKKKAAKKKKKKE